MCVCGEEGIWVEWRVAGLGEGNECFGTGSCVMIKRSIDPGSPA